MFCPVCSQQQVSEETRFCSRCGFLLTGISQVIAGGGVLPQVQAGDNPNALSARKKGLKQGALLMFLGLLFVPLTAIITIALRIEPFLVAAAVVLTFGGGILRMLYAMLFESKYPGVANENFLPEVVQKVLPGNKQTALPPQQSIPSSAYVPPASAKNWRQTNDLTAPPSVTDPTTKLLQKED